MDDSRGEKGFHNTPDSPKPAPDNTPDEDDHNKTNEPVCTTTTEFGNLLRPLKEALSSSLPDNSE